VRGKGAACNCGRNLTDLIPKLSPQSAVNCCSTSLFTTDTMGPGEPLSLTYGAGSFHLTGVFIEVYPAGVAPLAPVITG
jgi:hypothetical protein